ncbi:MAG: molybdenum cofactor guanylyltransferase [Methylovulum sp.]|nr:molybdenum cofactor guanylyltransferase [Methylovulum sp.]
MNKSIKVSGVILSGGRAKRMDNQDKGLVNYKGQPLVSYAIKAMLPVVDQLIINANRNLDQYRSFNLPVVTDQTNRFDGPLAGILTAMRFTDADILLVMPCDLPLIRPEHLQKLLSTCREQDTDIAVAYDGKEIQPLLLAIKTSLYVDLQNFLDSGRRKVGFWLAQKRMLKVDLSNEPDIFININTAKDLSSLEGRFC